MPNMQDFYPPFFLHDIIENAVGAENNLAQRSLCTSRICWTNKRKRSENSNVFQDTAPHFLCGVRVVLGNVVADLMEIRECVLRPNYFVFHAVAQDSSSCSASSCDFVRPAAISSRPFRIDAIIRNSSEISRRVAFSGSRFSASNTACLSVMTTKLLASDSACKSAKSLHDLQIRILLLQLLNRALGHLGVPQIQLGQFGELRQLLQAGIGDVGAVQIEVVEAR